MQMKKMIIKDLYNCEYITSDEELYPLQKWYNAVLDKTIDDVSVADVLRMFRQKEFMDIAYKKSVEFLQDNPFVGKLYDGELMKKVSELNDDELKGSSSSLSEIVDNALIQNEKYEWIDDDEQKEFDELLKDLQKRLAKL